MIEKSYADDNLYDILLLDIRMPCMDGYDVINPGDASLLAARIPLDTYQAEGAQPQVGATLAGALLLGQAVLAAAGSTQLGAAAIVAAITMVSVTASTQGVRLPAAATGLKYLVMAPTAKGVKVYPATGDAIGATGTNSAVALVLNKSSLFVAENTSHWRVLTGA